jgi:hypothetical protein
MLIRLLIACYGQKKDVYIEKAEESMTILTSAILPGSYMVDVLPWLKYVPSWFPGAGFQKVWLGLCVTRHYELTPTF